MHTIAMSVECLSTVRYIITQNWRQKHESDNKTECTTACLQFDVLHVRVTALYREAQSDKERNVVRMSWNCTIRKNFNLLTSFSTPNLLLLCMVRGKCICDLLRNA